MRLTVYFPEDSPTTHEFVGHSLTVGRLSDNEVQLEEGSVSSRHAEIVVQDGAVILRDLGSTNGTFLNGEQMVSEQELKEGDEIYFGSVRSVFMEPAAAVREAAYGVPENFVPLSPFPKPAKPRDVLGLAAWGSFGVGVAAALYALLVIFTG